MTISVTPTDEHVYRGVGDFLTAILPASVEVAVTQINRVPQPRLPNFVMMTILRRERMGTNVDSVEDCAFTASIAATVMTVTEVQIGTISVGALLLGEFAPAGAVIDAQLSGTAGGIGTYNLSVGGTVGSQQFASGQSTVTQNQMLTVQLDVYGPLAGKHATIITTLFRDTYGVKKFEDLGSVLVPLTADNAVQMPMIDAEKQYEVRYKIELALQANEVVSGLSQEFAAEIEVGVRSVDAEFPA